MKGVELGASGSQTLTACPLILSDSHPYCRLRGRLKSYYRKWSA